MKRVKNAVEYAKRENFTAVLEELEKLPPKAVNDFCEMYLEWLQHFVKDADISDLYEKMNDTEIEKFKYLMSSERERKYLMTIPEEEMTDQDWLNLRSCDF